MGEGSSKIHVVYVNRHVSIGYCTNDRRELLTRGISTSEACRELQARDKTLADLRTKTRPLELLKDERANRLLHDCHPALNRPNVLKRQHLMTPFCKSTPVPPTCKVQLLRSHTYAKCGPRPPSATSRVNVRGLGGLLCLSPLI